jgi:uncharacterized protein
MDIKYNVVGWFEIPVLDMDRAVKFYQMVFGLELAHNRVGPLDMAWFPAVDKGIGAAGSLVRFEPAYRPSPDGVVIYFTAFSGDLAVELSRVESAGGKVLQPKKLISKEIGYMGLFIDTEGNRIAVHSH